MLPVNTGFIFPDGTKLEIGAKGHRRCAYHYVVEHNLQEMYDKYETKNSGGEDDFLIDVLGAVKICHYGGTHYLYVPKFHGDYIEGIRRLYKRAGYKILYYYTDIISIDMNINLAVRLKPVSRLSYNRTVIEVTDSKGRKTYRYNPIRSGD